MTPSDYIYARCPGGRPSDAEVAAVLVWCEEWARDTFGDEQVDALAGYASPELALLRGCDAKIDGGLPFVLDDVRRVAARASLDAANARVTASAMRKRVYA